LLDALRGAAVLLAVLLSLPAGRLAAEEPKDQPPAEDNPLIFGP
jgi:hypothetical protein